MNVAEWILVVILSITLFIFLIVGIRLFSRLIRLVKEMEKIAIEGQNIAKNADGVVSNIRGMTSIGGTVEMLVDKYINQKLKSKTKDKEKEKNDGEE